MLKEIRIWCWQCSHCNYSQTEKSEFPELPKNWTFDGENKEHGPLHYGVKHFCVPCSVRRKDERERQMAEIRLALNRK